MKLCKAFLVLTSLFVLFGANSSVVVAQSRIEWRLDNPFRLFLNPKNTQAQLDLYHSLSEEEKDNPVLSMERRLSEKYPRGWTEEVFRETCWDSIRNRYRFCRGKGVNYINPKSHKVLVHLDGGFEPTDRCEWIFTPGVKQALRGQIIRKTALCGDELRFNVPYPFGGRIVVQINGRQRLKDVIKVKDVFIVGIGDSFASGEGNPDDPVQFTDDRSTDYGLNPAKQPMAGYPSRKGGWQRLGDGSFLREAARWQSRACHRSLYSYQLRAALQLALEDPHRAVTFAGFACSGSEITIGLFLRYKGNEWDRNPPQLPQLSYVSEELCGREASTPKDYTSGYSQLGKLPELQGMVLNKCYKPKRRIDLLLVSIGGNDVGFSSLVANAIFRDKTVLKKVGGWFGSVHDSRQSRRALKVLETRYKALNKAFHYMLRIPWKQSDRILLSAYPRMALQEDGTTLCPSGNQGMTLYPDFSVLNGKLKEASLFADELYRTMRKVSKRHGWTFVDGHREKFATHGFCATNPARIDETAEQLDLPRFSNNRWSSFKPSEFRPYASRQRWIRTPDDAYMTTHFHAGGLISRRLMYYRRSKWFQVVMAGTYSGSFHPTAEGHAAIADAVVKKARRVLAKYGK
ncbi:MAG: hypothetical protein L3J67_03820 [Hyphomicrobiaceae bacterium]|nr:hypothetical protein [Hyphomicrobiaceae bacterium]